MIATATKPQIHQLPIPNHQRRIRLRHKRPKPPTRQIRTRSTVSKKPIEHADKLRAAIGRAIFFVRRSAFGVRIFSQGPSWSSAVPGRASWSSHSTSHRRHPTKQTHPTWNDPDAERWWRDKIGKADPATFSGPAGRTNHDKVRGRPKAVGRSPETKSPDAEWWWRDKIGVADPATFSGPTGK